MNLTVFLLSFFLLQIFCLLIGRRASKKMEGQEDYFLAGRGLRFFPLMMTLIATQIGGGLILGSAEEAYRYGWWVLLYPLGAAGGLMVLALGVGKRLSRFKVATVAQLFEVVYNSSRLKKVASFLSIFSLFFILVAQVIASKKFMMSMGVEGELFFLVFWGLVIAYTVMGGLKAVVSTDVVQAVFFIAIFALCFCYSFFTSSETSPVLFQGQGGFDFDVTKLTGWLLMPLLFMVIEQDMGQRCFAARSERVVSWASGCAALCTIVVCVVPVFLGIYAKTLGLEVAPGGSVLMAVVAKTTTPVIAGLVGSAIMAAILSTADSLINAVSSNVAQDFNLTKSVGWARGLTAAIALLALGVSFAFSNVVDLLILSYELSVSALFVPIFMALFIKRGRARAALGAMVLGSASFLLFHFLPPPYLPREVISLLLSCVGYGLGELVRERKETLSTL